MWLAAAGVALLAIAIVVGVSRPAGQKPAQLALQPPATVADEPVAKRDLPPPATMRDAPNAPAPISSGGGPEATGIAASSPPGSSPAPVPPLAPPAAPPAMSPALPPGTVPSAGPQPAPMPAPAAPSRMALAVPPHLAGEPAWRKYAVAVPPTGGKPMIAIIIDDVGPSSASARRAIALPPPVTLSFLPYARDIVELTGAARAAGHELLVHVPMEPDDLAHNNPGPHALLTSMAPDEVLRSLRWGLDRFGGYVGINNHMGSRFTSRADDMTLVLGELKRRGLLFVDSKTSAQSVGADLARRMGVPETSRDIFLDNDSSPGKVAQQLAVTEAWARRHGRAIAIGHPHDGTLEALQRWLPEARARGFVLVPLTALVKAPPVNG